MTFAPKAVFSPSHLFTKTTRQMTATESRLRALISANLALDHEPSLDGGFSDAGISSMDAVAFMRIVEREFGTTIPPEDCARIRTFRKLVSYLDDKTG